MISIIVVTYNCDKYLIETLNSLIKQTSLDYEVCFIDGQSSDNTIDIIQDYKHKFESKGIQVTFISEKDLGIYDAMNKGILSSNGEFLFFLNAKDTFYDEFVISKVIEKIDIDIDIIYGKIFNGKESKQSKSISNQLIFNGICHQAAFIRRSLFLELGVYDLKYNISADFDFFVKSYCHGKVFEFINIFIANYDMDGFSSKKSSIRKGHEEYLEIISSNFNSINKYKGILRYTLMKTKFETINLLKDFASMLVQN